VQNGVSERFIKLINVKANFNLIFITFLALENHSRQTKWKGDKNLQRKEAVHSDYNPE